MTLSAPTCNDVICGRGGRGPHHEGNKKYLQIIEDSLPFYISAKKGEKIQLAKTIVDRVHQQTPRGRFMKREKGAWTELDTYKAVKKTSQSFRDLLLKQQRSIIRSIDHALSESSVTMVDACSQKSKYSATPDGALLELFPQQPPARTAIEKTTNSGTCTCTLETTTCTNSRPALVVGEVYVSESEKSLAKWLDEAGLLDKLFFDKESPEDSKASVPFEFGVAFSEDPIDVTCNNFSVSIGQH